MNVQYVLVAVKI